MVAHYSSNVWPVRGKPAFRRAIEKIFQVLLHLLPPFFLIFSHFLHLLFILYLFFVFIFIFIFSVANQVLFGVEQSVPHAHRDRWRQRHSALALRIPLVLLRL
jgi:hypothetical protein